MGREGDAKVLGGTQRPMETTVLVMVATLVLLSATASRALDWHHHVCLTDKNIIKLLPYETTFFSTDKTKVSVKVEAEGCANEKLMLDLRKFTVSNETYVVDKNLKWYEFSFINCKDKVAKIGSKIVKFSEISSKCIISKAIKISFESDVLLGRKCTRSGRGREVEQNKAACKTLEGVPDTGRRLMEPALSNFGNFDFLKNYKTSDLLQQDTITPAGDDNDDKNIFDTLFSRLEDPKESEVDKLESYHNWPKINYGDILRATPASRPTYNEIGFNSNTGFSKGRNYKENAIPIFIGIVLLTVSMCLRFCLCRGKSVVRRVTTVTVIRSRPAGPDVPQDQQDPPPSYIDVVNEATSPQSPADEGCVEPPPPAYADIVDEVLPPTYSEVEAQSMTTPEEAPLADQEAEAHTTQPPSDPESVPDAKGSVPSKNMLSKYRSQQKQFAFKVLEEDE